MKKKKKYVFEEGRPHQEDSYFDSGDFEKLVKESQNTVDLIFRNGIDWKAFLISYKHLEAEVGENVLSVQSFEHKGDGTFIVKIEVPPELDKARIENFFEEKYETELLLRDK